MPEVTQSHWETIAQRFQEKWRFPNCIGSIDMIHESYYVKCPDNAGSMYFSNLKKHSIVLLAVVGPKYEFVCIDIGGYGKIVMGVFLRNPSWVKNLKVNSTFHMTNLSKDKRSQVHMYS